MRSADLQSLLPCPLMHFEWAIEVLVSLHLEPFLGIMLNSQPRLTHSQLRVIFQTLNRWSTLLRGFHLPQLHTMPCMFSQLRWIRTRVQKNMDLFRTHLSQYDSQKLETNCDEDPCCNSFLPAWNPVWVWPRIHGVYCSEGSWHSCSNSFETFF